ncbi:MAG: hypothetical protein MUD01_11290 [Chloroflexaceae bacterium]|nr:hypothetical protein [Chloroflexaceae bacterium]
MVAPHVVSIRSEYDILAARIAARDVARRIGFNAVDQARIAIATTELAQTLLSFPGEGCIIINQVYQGPYLGIELVVEASPGYLEDDVTPVEQRLSQRASTVGPNDSRRLMDAVQVDTVDEAGGRVTVFKWLTHPTESVSA